MYNVYEMMTFSFVELGRRDLELHILKRYVMGGNWKKC